MRHLFSLLFFLVTWPGAFAQRTATPEEIFGALFYDVQRSGLFPDSKTFADVIPKRDPGDILSDYLHVKNNPAVRFSLPFFIKANFILPDTSNSHFATSDKNIVTHIQQLWKVLARTPRSDSCQSNQGWCRGSLLALPERYVVPGGRFREVYYWDSYFTMLGLRGSKEMQLLKNMVDNFAYLIQTYGHIPNGNRSYYLSRSQPPFFSLMVDLLAEIDGPKVYGLYLAALEKEYHYWMDRSSSKGHLVKMPDGSYLNRYWDQLSVPRTEAFAEDEATVDRNTFTAEQQKKLYRDLRSAAESGWDFSSRWLKTGDLSSIQTTSLIPVDLNCLLYHLELTLAKGYRLGANSTKFRQYSQLAEKRKSALQKYCWSSAIGWYVDYNIDLRKQSTAMTLAGMFPFFLRLADSSQFKKARSVLAEKFLRDGGLVTTLVNSGQQWDSPNGWAPLQWVSIMGLENYGERILSKSIATRWCSLVKRVFDATGKLVEKYDVVDANKKGGGGEYPSQDGFGWTNGVYLALINQYKL